MDPKPVVGISDYATFANNPVLFSDALGDTITINLFGPNDKPSFHAAANAGVQNQINDGVFIVYAHGNSDGLQYYDDKKKNDQFAASADAVTIVLNDKSKGMYNKAIDDGKNIVVIINACNVVSNDYYDEHFGQGEIHRDKTIAQDLSKKLGEKGIVYAPDGYGLYNRDLKKPGVLGFHNQDGDAGMLKIVNGEIKSKKRIQRAKPTEHAIGKRRGLIGGIEKKQIIKKK